MHMHDILDISVKDDDFLARYDRFVADVKRIAIEKFNLNIDVIMDRSIDINPWVLLNAADAVLAKTSRESYPEGIKTKCRKRNLVFLRQSFCIMCYQGGMSKNSIKDLIELDRVTVIHSIRTAKDMLETKHKEFTMLYDKLRQEYESQLKTYKLHNGVDVPGDNVWMQNNEGEKPLVFS